MTTLAEAMGSAVVERGSSSPAVTTLVGAIRTLLSLIASLGSRTPIVGPRRGSARLVEGRTSGAAGRRPILAEAVFLGLVGPDSSAFGLLITRTGIAVGKEGRTEGIRKAARLTMAGRFLSSNRSQSLTWLAGRPEPLRRRFQRLWLPPRPPLSVSRFRMHDSETSWAAFVAILHRPTGV